MEKIFFAGNIEHSHNAAMLKTLLGRYSVQVIGDSSAMLGELIDIMKPSVVFVSLFGQSDPLKQLVGCLGDKHPGQKVLIYGTQDDISEASDFMHGSFRIVTGPVTPDDVISECEKLLSGSVVPGSVPEAEEIQSEEPVKSRKRVLIVDDNQIMLRSIRDLIKERYDTSMAVSGAQAFALLEKKDFDLMLLDYKMPELDGIEVYGRLRKTEKHKTLPVIFLTAASSNKEIIDILALAPEGYILKPPEKESLLRKIDEIIGH
ncbi:MAG: response regulator [Oscillospiraceae bacterium]|nr:response regulator [Oscillospiraceae bacterium]